MFSVVILNSIYRVGFRHDQYRPHKHGVGETSCRIYRDKSSDLPSTKVQAVVRCSASEPGGYNKNEGRKRALARALYLGEFTRLHRTLFWGAYWDKRGKVD